MKPLWWMIGASLLSWLGVTAVSPGDVNPEILLGMAGPLASAAVTWVMTARTQAAAPAAVLAVMMKALLGKMVFFAAYVAVMLRVLDLRPHLFVASFTTYFIALFLMQALFMARLFGGDATHASSRA
jgi:hypothetical protein